MKKEKRNTRGTVWGKALALVAVVLMGFPGVRPALAAKAPSREAAIHFSDGTVLEGTVLLTPGTDFNLTVLGGGDAKSFKKVQTFNVDVIREMTFRPHRERYERRFTFSGPVFVSEKTYQGEPYPVREPQCTVVFNSGEERTGILTSTVIYLKEKDPDTGMLLSTKKFFLRSKEKGEPGDELSDLVYVKRITMLDDGKKFERSLAVEFLSIDPGSLSELAAITQNTLTGVPVKVGEGNEKIEVLSTFGENVFLAGCIGGRYVAGWPEEGARRTELFEQVEAQFLKKEDYYNERKLLGILPLDNGRRMLTLVSLRRQVSAESIKWLPGKFEYDVNGEAMEFFRLSVWLWHRDPETGTMALVDRGSFFRVKVADKDETPPSGICPELWPIVMQDGKILVGKKKEVDP